MAEGQGIPLPALIHFIMKYYQINLKKDTHVVIKKLAEDGMMAQDQVIQELLKGSNIKSADTTQQNLPGVTLMQVIAGLNRWK